MAGQGDGYPRRDPESTLLHRLVRDRGEMLFAEVRAADPAGRGLPRFVEEEIRQYGKCGVLAQGLTLWRCTKCGQEMAVAFSCKTRFCPSCASRRMHAVSLDLLQRVLPVVPYRH